MSTPAFTIGSTTWPGLAKSIEEGAELGAVLGQLVTFPAGYRPDGVDLIERLHEELGDALAALDLLQLLNPTLINRELVRERRALKLERWVDWHDRELNEHWVAITCLMCDRSDVLIADRGPTSPGWLGARDGGWWCPDHAHMGDGCDA